MPVEIIARELDSRILITHKALEKGFSVVIGTKGAVKRLARSHGRGIYFYKDHTPMSSQLLQELRAAGMQIVALDEEGLSWPSQEVYAKRIDTDVINVSDAIFAWGQRQHEVLTSYVPQHADKMHIVGNPRFDILHERYDQYLKDQSASQLSYASEGYVLINSMFTPGNWNPHLYGTSSYVEHMVSRGLIKNEEDRKFYTKVSENAAQLLEAYIAMLEHLSKEFPDTQFVIRPHPDENHDIWHEHFSAVDNVAVEYGGSAVYWIKGAKVLIYTGCTTAIEAWAIGKPTLRYHPIPETKFGPYLPNRFGKTLVTETELVDELHRVLEGQSTGRYEVNEAYAKGYIHNAYSADAADRIVAELDSLTRSAGNGDDGEATSLQRFKNRLRLLFLFDLRKRWGSRIVGKIRRTIQGEGKEQQARVERARSQKFPGLTHTDIESRLMSLDRLAGVSPEGRWNIKRIAPDTFRIDRNQG